MFMLVSSGAGYGAAIVIEAGTGAVLHDENSDYRHYPASLTKIMTLYLAFEAIENGSLTLTEKLAVSSTAAAQGGTKLRLKSGEKISVEDAILATIIRSANDAAVVLAERMADSETAFAALMTAKAEALGLTRTVFQNATGLPNTQQWSTARDMARLAKALLSDFPQRAPYFARRSFRFRGGSLPGYNGLLTSFPGADGVKTGFTCASGYNLVASASRGGRRLIAVLLGSRTRAERRNEVARLLTAAFSGDPGDAATIDELLPTAPELQLPPDLSAEIDSCAGLNVSSARKDGRPPLPSEKPGPRAPRWAVEFGAYASQRRARAVVERVMRRGGEGLAFVVPSASEGSRRFTAGIRDLEELRALSLCKKRHDRGRACRVVSPAEANLIGASGEAS